MKRNTGKVMLTAGLVALTLAASSALAASPPSAADAAPTGWFHAGSAPKDYAMGVDAKVLRSGKGSGFIKAKTEKPAGFGTMMQTIGPEDFRGSRVRMSGWIKSADVSGWAGMWMRVDGPVPNRSLAFDNMQPRAIKGTAEWQKYEVVLDVAPEATAIAFGVLLDGPGTVWLDDVSFAVVDKSVPVTDLTTAGGATLPSEPANLDFEK